MEVENTCKVCEVQKSQAEFCSQASGRPDTCKACWSAYICDRYHNNQNFRLITDLRRKVNKFYHSPGKGSKYVAELLGCTAPEFRDYLASKFPQGMTHQNRSLWHIDHIVPLHLGDMQNPQHVKSLWHHTNLQPLWASENKRKGVKTDMTIDQLLLKG